MAYKISIKTTITGGSDEAMAQSTAAVAENLDEIQQHTPGFLGFTLSSDRKARTALFNMYVDEDDPVRALSAAHAWAVTAINAAGDGTREWQMYAHPEEREQVRVLPSSPLRSSGTWPTSEGSPTRRYAARCANCGSAGSW